MPCSGEPVKNLEGSADIAVTLDAALECGLADADAGRIHAAEDVFAELKARYAGLPTEQPQE